MVVSTGFRPRAGWFHVHPSYGALLLGKTAKKTKASAAGDHKAPANHAGLVNRPEFSTPLKRENVNKQRETIKHCNPEPDERAFCRQSETRYRRPVNATNRAVSKVTSG